MLDRSSFARVRGWWGDLTLRHPAITGATIGVLLGATFMVPAVFAALINARIIR